MKPFVGAISLVLAACAQNPSVTAIAASEVQPEITEYMAQPAVLVFSETLGWRHNEGIAGADRFFADYSSARQMGLFTTANSAVFNDAQLARFDLVVLNNMTGAALSPQEQRALQQWLENGGAVIALHSAGDDTHQGWPWFDQEMIGPEFVGHPADPQFQEARVVNLAPDHPIMRGIPAEWRAVDEWYSFDDIAKLGNAIALLGLDESTYSPANLLYGPRKDLRMGGGLAGHPIAWVRCPGKGRFFYSAIGHSHTAYDDPIYRQLLTNAAQWTTRKGDPETGCPRS